MDIIDGVYGMPTLVKKPVIESLNIGLFDIRYLHFPELSLNIVRIKILIAFFGSALYPELQINPYLI